MSNRFPGNNYPRNSFQEINGKDGVSAGMTPTPLTATFPNRDTNPHAFLTENYQNQNQVLASTDYALRRGIINDNKIKYPKNPREYGLYLDRKEFKLETPLWPNISENVASENVNEYVVVIDSSDRDTALYPSPFALQAYFGESTDITKLNVPQVFENVKFMRIENVVLPRSYFLTQYPVPSPASGGISSNATILAQLTSGIGATGAAQEASQVQTIYNNLVSSYITSSALIPNPLTSGTTGSIDPSGNVETVYVTNLKTYTYTVTVKYQTLTGYNNSVVQNNTTVYTITYPSVPTYTQYYSQTLVSGTNVSDGTINNQITNFNPLTLTSGSATYTVPGSGGTSSITYTYVSSTLQQYYIEFMMALSSNGGYRCSYEILATPGATGGTVNFYYFSSKSLDSDRYLILTINEITDNNINSTNNALRQAFCLLYPDSYGELHYYAATNYQDKIWKMSNLANINRLTLNLSDSFGNPLQMPNLDYYVTTGKICNCTGTNYACPCFYIRHPYYKWLQVQYMIKFGVVETEIDKKIFY